LDGRNVLYGQEKEAAMLVSSCNTMWSQYEHSMPWKPGNLTACGSLKVQYLVKEFHRLKYKVLLTEFGLVIRGMSLLVLLVVTSAWKNCRLSMCCNTGNHILEDHTVSYSGILLSKYHFFLQFLLCAHRKILDL